jgi:O-antigen/teichoic acid export membrane protein
VNSLLALGARATTMIVSLVCGVLTTRLALGSAGVEYYAIYTVLIGIPALLAFTDLGTGAVLVNSVATDDRYRRSPKVRGELRSVWRIMISFATVTMAVNTLLLVTGGWSVVLGTAGQLRGAQLAAFVSLTIFCIAIPLGVWTRILLGMRRNHIVILLQGLISPLTLLSVWILLTLGTEAVYPFLVVGSFFATAFVGFLGFTLTARMTQPLIGDSARYLLAPRRHPGLPVMDVGWPMLAQLLSPPIAVSTQRLVLAQWGTQAQVAEYGVAGQVFFALQGLVLAAGVALWPLYARRRAHGTLQHGPAVQSLIFGGSVAIATLLIWVLGPWIFGFITDGTLEVTGPTILSFGLMITCIATAYPLGMFIMDKPGLRFQVAPTLIMAFGSLGLSILLVQALGTPGPMLANSIAMILCQIIPFAVYIHLHRARLLSTEDPSQEPVAAELQEGSAG